MASSFGQHLLVPTKLLPPRSPAALVGRERLLAQLVAQPTTRLTLVVAPAGFGKSTLAAQWLAAQPAGAGLSGWLTLDEHDQEPVSVLAYLASAIERAAPGALPTTLPLLRALETPPAYAVVQALLVDLHALAQPMTLVLDDYHAVAAAPVHHTVGYLLRRLPAHCRVILLSRADPALPVARLRAEGQVTELRAADLRFTEAEAAALLGRLLGAALDGAEVAAVHQQTEGWAIALQLTALARRAAPGGRGIGGARWQLAQYMAEEVLDRQPEELRQALLAFAVPERFCAGLCAALLGEPAAVARAEELLAQLERANLLLVPLGAGSPDAARPSRAWFRFHHLFRDLLLQRLQLAVDQGQVRALQLRAAGWLAAEGLAEEAIRLFLAGGDQDAAGALVEGLLYRELGRDGSSQPPRHWLGLLPAELRARRPGLALIEARLANVQMDHATSAASIALVDALLADPAAAGQPLPWPSFRGDLEVLRGTLLYWQGRPAEAVEALTLGLRQGTVQALATSGLLFLGRAYVSAGRYDEGVALIDGLHGPFAGTGVQVGEARRHTALCMMHELAGRVDAFAREARRLGDTLADQKVAGSWATFAASYSGRAAYERSELSEAASHFGTVREHRYQTNAYNLIGCLIGLALIALAQGAPDEAALYAEEAHAFAAEMGGRFLRNEALGCAVHLALAQGDRETASRLAGQIAPDDQLGARAWYAIPPPQLSQARALIAAGGDGLAQAEGAIDGLLAQVEAMHNMRPLVAALAVRALLRQAQGRPAEALATLERAVGLAAPLGLVRTLVDCGPDLAPLLRAVGERGVATAYVGRLVAMIEAAPAASAPIVIAPPLPLLPEQLTRRELEILGLLAGRWSDKEIAERLRIAPNTVRKHTSTIYGKLGVGSRREAANVARSLGILPAP